MNSFHKAFGILFLLFLLLLLLFLLLTVLLLLLVLLVLIVVLLVLLVLLFVLTVIAFLVFIFFLVLTVPLTATVLLLLLLCLLEQFLGIGQVVAGVVVLRVEFQCLLVVGDGLLELLHTFGSVFLLQACLEVAVATVVEDTAACFLVQPGMLKGLAVMLCRLLILLLAIEGVA